MPETPRPPERTPTPPDASTLRRASVLAVVVGALLVVGVVLPAETASDPLGMGKWLGLAEMGQIKVALATEAAEEEAAEAALLVGASPATVPSSVSVASDVRGTEGEATGEPVAPLSDGWRDSVTFTLEPSGSIEYKLTMQEGERARFLWETDGAEVYYNTHGEPPNAPRGFRAHTYERGSAPSAEGELVAVYEGIHGWFWRNRSDSAMTITLRTRGEYLELREIP